MIKYYKDRNFKVNQDVINILGKRLIRALMSCHLSSRSAIRNKLKTCQTLIESISKAKHMCKLRVSHTTWLTRVTIYMCLVHWRDLRVDVRIFSPWFAHCIFLHHHHFQYGQITWAFLLFPVVPNLTNCYNWKKTHMYLPNIYFEILLFNLIISNRLYRFYIYLI